MAMVSSTPSTRAMVPCSPICRSTKAIAGGSLLADKEGLFALLNEGQDTSGIPGYMPAVGQGWPDAQLDDLLAYLQQADLAPAPAQGG